MQNPQDDINNDFQNELYQLLSQEFSYDDDLCLISNLPLEINHITLSCGHKFNYNSIYNEIKYQKLQYHNLETQKLTHSEIKCPYCRTIQKGLLPCRNNFENIIGVNWPKKYQYKANICGYIFLSGKRKGLTCGKKCFDKYCEGHTKIIQSREAKKLVKEKKKESKNVFAATPDMCKYIFKRGKKKHQHCVCKKIYKEGVCKSHYKQCKNKIEKINNPINNPTNNTMNNPLVGQNIVIQV